MKYIGLYMIIPYLYMIFWFGLLLVIFKFIINYLKNKNKKQIKNVDKSIYYRDIPCSGNIDLAYWLLYNFSDLKKADLNNGLIGAYLLNWYKNGYIDIKQSQNMGIKNDNYNIDLKDGNWTKNYIESRIYNFLKNVAGNNNLLEKNEIRNYCSVDGNKFELKFLFENILKEIQKDLEEKEYITVDPSKNYILFKKPSKIILSEELLNEYKNINGLKNFLLDYSNIEEKIHIEVHLWEDYLIFANLLGIANKVKQQFNKIYPDFNVVNTMFDISFDNNLLGPIKAVYISSKIQFITLIVSTLLVALIFLDANLFKSTLKILLPSIIVIGFVFWLYWLLRKYFINKKVKEMNKKTYAKIIDVQIHYNTERDYETNREITTKSYSFTYEYIVNGTRYTGYGHSNFWKRKGQSIKIYYNDVKPDKSETAQKHNYYLKIFIFTIAILIMLYIAINHKIY